RSASYISRRSFPPPLAPAPLPPLFPYTTLFRSPPAARRRGDRTVRPYSGPQRARRFAPDRHRAYGRVRARDRRSPEVAAPRRTRSEEHTSELQSLRHLVCRLLLEKKKESDMSVA